MIPRSSFAPASPGLRLHALDAEDLACLSAHLQDALVRVGDLAYVPEKRLFAFIGSRFDWASEAEGRRERCCTGVHFEGVRRVRQRGVARDRPEAFLELLALTFEPAADEPPGGVIRLIFAGGASILLDVECVEARLCDLGPRWGVKACPSHELDESRGGGP